MISYNRDKNKEKVKNTDFIFKNTTQNENNVVKYSGINKMK